VICVLTKTQSEIMKIFASRITERFSIKKISELLKKPYPLVHRSAKGLIQKGFLLRDKQNFLSLNYKQNHAVIAYMESLRKEEFLRKNKTLSLFVKDVLERIKLDFFVFLVFGSSAGGSLRPRDVDILMIIGDKTKIGSIEKVLHNVASNLSMAFDINVISTESSYEMLSKREEPNIMNETLDNHIIFFGAENYYRLLKNAR